MSDAWKTGSNFNSTFGDHMYLISEPQSTIPVTNALNNAQLYNLPSKKPKHLATKGAVISDSYG